MQSRQAFRVGGISQKYCRRVYREVKTEGVKYNCEPVNYCQPGNSYKVVTKYAAYGNRKKLEFACRFASRIITIARQFIFAFSMVVSISESFLVFSVLLICLPGCSDSRQEVIQAAAGKRSINHGCPSWFIPINNSSDRCKCGEPIHNPGRVVLCNPNTNQTLVQAAHCMDYNEEDDVVFVGQCPFINKKGEVQGLYVKFPQNVSELNPFLCSGLNRTGVMCSQCQEGLGTPIFSISMQCLPCMSSCLGWTLYIFLATFPTTIFFLVVLIHEYSNVAALLLDQ